MMHSRSLVSIIIPFYNTAPEFMKEAIESVFGQSYRNWEMLLVNDGSTGESAEVALRYAEQYPEQARYLEHRGRQHRGASAARQLGINHARGVYIAFLDADDVWLPRKLEQQVAILDLQPEAAMVYGATLYWHSWTGKPEDNRRDYAQKHGIQADVLVKPPLLLTLFLQGKTAIPCTSSVIARRETIAGVGGFEESFRNLNDDQVFYAKIALEAAIFVSNECWDKYRQHPDSLCAVAAKGGQLQSAHLTYLNWLASYLSDQGVQDPEVWQVLRKRIWLYSYPNWFPLPKRALYFLRWAKKWLLRVEERLLPAPIHRWVWLRE